MTQPPKLTTEQREQLAMLEPSLRNAVRLSDYDLAKSVTHQIQGLLRSTGHETRLMQAKTWLFEAALEAGEIQTAISGFIGIRNKTNPRTRVHLEATALLAICYLRTSHVEKAKPLMEEVLRNDKCIRSAKRRRQFQRRIISRFGAEAALAELRGTGSETLVPAHLEEEAGELVRTCTEDELLDRVGDSIPPPVVLRILEIDQFSRAALPNAEVRYLPSPESIKQKKEVGRTVFSSLKTVLYQSLCDPNSEVYQTWSKEGLGAVLNRKYIGAAVAAMCLNLGIGIKALAVSVVALILRVGIEVYCDRFKPEGIMIGRDEE